ncbi:hypothetical protein F5883DRAFT_539614 [Diaporthe sp. PMI_573]|nr:hypothetical protein F5883DRAFT_539614 [Diaporthaceae sp. PMI_573]
MSYLKLFLSCSVPILYLLLAIFSFHFALHNSNHVLRLALLFPFLYFAVYSFIASDRFFIPALTSLWAQSVALNIVHIISLILIENHPAPHHNSVLSLLQPSSLLETWRIWCNPQLLPEARKSVPKTAMQPHEPQSVFILLRVAKLLLYYSLHMHILPALFSETILELYAVDVSEPALFSRLAHVSAREAVVRSYVALSWIWESIVFLDGSNAILSLVGVISGFDSPADWPPMFGNVNEVRGLRSFWARFWHRLASRPYGNVGRTMAFGLGSLLGLGRTFPWAQVQGMLVAFVVFLLSGVSHAAVSWRLGMRDWLDIKWFLVNFMACFIEIYFLSAVQYLAQRASLTTELRALEKSWLGRIIGYSWVFAFFFWSVPMWKFPRMHRELAATERWKLIWSRMKVCGGDIPCT